MKSRPLPFSRVYRQFRYWSKQINRQLADGSFEQFSPQKKARIQAKLKRLYHRLTRVVSARHLKHVLAGAAIVLGLAGPMQAQNFAPGVQNPFGLSGNSYFNVHTLVDIDGDGDLDIITSVYDQVTYNTVINFVENTGTASAPTFAAPIANTFGLVAGQGFTDFDFADMDGDGDLDAIGGTYGGQVSYQENTGTSIAPAFSAPVNNPFGIPNGYIYSFPSIADLDGDGDFDLLITEYYGEFMYYENTGTNMMPAFATGVVAPFGLPNAGSSPDMYHHELVDLDGDGDFDIISGSYYYPNSDIFYFENTGTVNAPSFAAAQVNPFGLSTNGELALMAVGDLDDDNDFDVLTTEIGGIYTYFENIDSVSNPVNTPPSLDTLASQTVCSGDTLVLPFMASDADGDSLTFLASSDNQTILTDASINIVGTAPSFTLGAVPIPGNFGVVNITVSALDGTDTTSTTFPLLVEDCNTAPAIGTLNNVSICRDSTWDSFTFQILDAEGDSLTVAATSDNQTLLPDANIGVTGGIPVFTFSGTPATGETGTATVTIIANDGQAADTATFSLEVVACNSAPVIGNIEDQTACSNFVYGPIDFMVSDADNDGLTVEATSSNQTLLPDANITLAGTAPDYTFTLQAVQGETGTTEVTITASDDSTSTSSSFTVTVDACTHIAEPAFAKAMRLFPNPTTGQMSLVADQSVVVQSLEIMDLRGRTVLQEFYGDLRNRWELNLEALPAGTYVLRIRTEEGVANRRIVKR